MTPKDRSRRPRLRTMLAALDIVDLVAGSNLRHAGSVIALLGTALVGCAVLGAVLALAGLVVVVLGVSRGPLAALGTAILSAGLVIGLAAAAIVMHRIIRRLPALTTIAGFREPDDSPDDEVRAEPSRFVEPGRASSGDRLRALDARLTPPPTAHPADAGTVDLVEPRD